MLRGYQDGKFAIGLIIGGSLAIFLIVWIIGLNYCPNSPCNYQSSNSEYVYEVPLGRGPNTTSVFNEADKEGHPKYYERQDLRAQEVMARATNAIALMTGISVIIGVFGMIALVYTLALQRKNNEIADNIGRHQLRAYLQIISAQIIVVDGNLKACMTVRNAGHTIAYEVSRVVGQYVGPVTPDDEMKDVFPEKTIMSNLGPQQEHTYIFGITENMLSELRGLDGGSTQLRYGGIITYRDAFGIKHETGFAYRTNADEEIKHRNLHMSTKGNYST